MNVNLYQATKDLKILLEKNDLTFINVDHNEMDFDHQGLYIKLNHLNENYFISNIDNFKKIYKHLNYISVKKENETIKCSDLKFNISNKNNDLIKSITFDIDCKFKLLKSSYKYEIFDASLTENVIEIKILSYGNLFLTLLSNELTRNLLIKNFNNSVVKFDSKLDILPEQKMLKTILTFR